MTSKCSQPKTSPWFNENEPSHLISIDRVGLLRKGQSRSLFANHHKSIDEIAQTVALSSNR